MVQPQPGLVAVLVMALVAVRFEKRLHAAGKIRRPCPRPSTDKKDRSHPWSSQFLRNRKYRSATTGCRVSVFFGIVVKQPGGTRLCRWMWVQN